MDKDRIRGSAEQAKGKVKEVAAAKLRGTLGFGTAEGKSDRAAGKVPEMPWADWRG